MGVWSVGFLWIIVSKSLAKLILHSPPAMPHSPKRCTDYLHKSKTKESEVALDFSGRIVQIRLVLFLNQPRVALPKSTSYHDLIEQKPTIPLARFAQEHFVGSSKHLTKHPHQCTCKRHQMQAADCLQGLLPFLPAASLSQHVVVIHHLLQPNAFIKKMTVNVQQNENKIESPTRQRETKFRTVLEPYNLSTGPTLETTVGNGIVHPAWPPMGLHRHFVHPS